jgi:hypothetical protein
MLNIKEHTCGPEHIRVYGPVDMEGHKGLDGRKYLLDFSRVFPPEVPRKDKPMSHLYRLFRPEFVRVRIPFKN